MNTCIFSSLKKSSKLAKIYYSNSPENNKEGVINQANKCFQPILEAKEQKIAKTNAKLDEPKTAQKTYWSILSRFLGNEKILITPLALILGKLIAGFKKKANPFNSHFAAHCTVVNNATRFSAQN